MCFCSRLTWVHPRLQPANTGQAGVMSGTVWPGVKTPGLESGLMVWKLTFWPRKRLLVERTVKLSTGDPSVVLSADAALLTSPCFCWDKWMHNINHPAHKCTPPHLPIQSQLLVCCQKAVPSPSLLIFLRSASWPPSSWQAWVSSRGRVKEGFPVYLWLLSS